MISRSLSFRGRLWLAVAMLLPAVSAAATEPDYPPVVPGVAIEFPRDAGSHPDHRIEWWYVTGWLADKRGQQTGFQVTFFRVRPGLGEDNPSRFAPRQLLFAHAAVADPALGRLRHAERSARAGFDLAYARRGAMDVRIDDWSLRETGDGRMQAVVAGADFSLELDLSSRQAPLLQGEAGFSRKGPGALSASYYYSRPQLAVAGELSIDGRRSRVTGQAWLDHEWSSQTLDFEASGWDWIGINLDGGGALMAFRMRDARGGVHWAAATLRSADGAVRTFAPEDVRWSAVREWRSPRTGASYPIAWQISIGDDRYSVEPLIDDAELDSRSSTGTIYWEGPVQLRTADGRPAGRGYLELTGYAK